MLELSGGLAGRGHEVRVVAPRPRQPGEVNTAPQRVGLRYVPVLRVLGLRPLSYLVASGLVMAIELLRWRPEILLWVDSPGQFSPLLCASLWSCPYVLLVNGLPSEELRGVWHWPLVRGLVTSVLRQAARRAEAIVSVCEEILVWMQKSWAIPSQRCHVIRNGVDPMQFRPADPLEARRHLGLDGAHPYIGFVGGFFPWHGLETLVHAVPRVLDQVPNARFLLVGDGQMRPVLERTVQEMGVQHAVQFPGRVGFQEVPQWIAACDLCVVLHRPVRFYPGDSMKLWEYLACARPVVATAGSGYGDTVEELGAGVSVMPDNPQHLAGQIVRLLGDPEWRAKMGERGRQAVEQAHTWGARTAHLEGLLREAAGRAARS